MAGYCFNNIKMMIGMLPKISVLTSCYNATEFLADAIESILSQTYEEFEFILIDDGSTDDTSAIIKHYAAKDNRIVFIEKGNTGLTDSLNVGISVARGEWIARMDADDVAFPDRFEKQINFVMGHPEVVLLGAGCITIDRKGREIQKYRYPATHDELIKQIEQCGTPFPHSTAFYKRSVVQSVGAYRNRLNGAEDKDLWLRLSSIGRIGCLSDPLIKLRKHSASITAAKGNRLTVLSYAAVISYFLRKNDYTDPVEERESRFHLFLSWSENKLLDAKVFESERLWSEIGREWRAARGLRILKVAAVTTKQLVFTCGGWLLLKKRFLGSKLAREIAMEWGRSNLRLQ